MRMKRRKRPQAITLTTTPEPGSEDGVDPPPDRGEGETPPLPVPSGAAGDAGGLAGAAGGTLP